MLGFPLICLMSVFLFISLVCVECQDFCQSYQQNNYHLIVYSQSNDTLLLIVDRYFWGLKENNSQLVFDRQDFNASNSSEQWTESKYVFAHPVYDQTDDGFRGIALFKDIHNISKKGPDFFRQFRYDYYRFYDNYFEFLHKSNVIDLKYWREAKETRFVSNIINKTWNIEFEQYKVKGVFKREYTYRLSLLGNLTKINATLNETGLFFIQLLKLFKNYTELNNPIIGCYMNSTLDFIFFFRIEENITYCAIDQCIRKEFNVLVSCPETVNTFIPYVWILVFIVVVLILVFVIILTIVICYIRTHKTQPKNKYETSNTDLLTSAATIQTVDSQTGVPMNNSKSKMSINSEVSVSQQSKTIPKQDVIKGSPKPIQKFTKPEKPK